jgi:hypothetical protein
MNQVLASYRLRDSEESLPGSTHCVSEVAFRARVKEGDPWLNAAVDALVTAPDGRSFRVPAFWAGGTRWKFRYAPDLPGEHRFRLVPSEGNVTITGPDAGALDAVPYVGDNPLLLHGPIRVAEGGPYFEHADGTPFFWLADSWWHGMSSRLTWAGYRKMLAYRKQQGYNTLQFTIGFACDVRPFDPRDTNEAGHPWEPEYRTINPAYFDRTDRRVLHLVEEGFLPSLMGMWGYHIGWMGVEKAKRHWRYVIARYGALPVVWTLCGEASLRYYGDPLIPRPLDDAGKQIAMWTDVARYVRQIDPWHRPLTVHPLNFQEPLTDMDVIDFYIGQRGHSSLLAFRTCTNIVRDLAQMRARYPKKPALVSEVAWENMDAGCGPRVQRYVFWLAVLNGAPGHSYGADALWQMNSRKEPFGPSPHGGTWGNEPWEDAYKWAGAEHVSVGARILRRFPWWRMEPHPEWIEPATVQEDKLLYAAAAGLPHGIRIHYMAQQRATLRELEPGKAYRATYYDPLNGQEHKLGEPLRGDQEGKARIPRCPHSQDWVLVLDPVHA